AEPAAFRGDAAAAGLGQWRGGADILVGGPREPARPAIRSRMVRRAGEVETCRSLLRHAAIRAAAGRAAAAADYDDTAAPAPAEAPACRSNGDGDADADAGECGKPGQGFHAGGGAALWRNASGA